MEKLYKFNGESVWILNNEWLVTFCIHWFRVGVSDEKNKFVYLNVLMVQPVAAFGIYLLDCCLFIEKILGLFG